MVDMRQMGDAIARVGRHAGVAAQSGIKLGVVEYLAETLSRVRTPEEVEDDAGTVHNYP